MQSIYSADGYTFSPYNYPDNVATAETAFNNGDYLQQMDFQLDQTTDLRIGIRKFTPCINDWMCCDNFRLFYIGDDPTGIKTTDYSPADNGKTYDLNGRIISQPVSHGIIIRNGKKIMMK
jgi:hypothetical protein